MPQRRIRKNHGALYWIDKSITHDKIPSEVYMKPELDLPKEFVDRMRNMLADSDAFFESLKGAPVRGLRVNLLKADIGVIKALPFRLIPSETLEEGFVLLDDACGIGNHPLHIAGLFYMQEPSAMSAIAAAEVSPGDYVLDMCAAPGGKTTGIAARLGGKGLLIANEIVPSRAKLLCRNVERMGITNCIVTSASPSEFEKCCLNAFDKVIVDAPCSGEGMFRKDPAAILEWSLEHVSASAKRQSNILDSAAITLRPGGKLIYSTCTFSLEENEEVLEAFIKRHSDFSLISSKRLYPHLMRGEGHFVAVLEKGGAATVKGAIQLDPTQGLKPVKSGAIAAFFAENISDTSGLLAFESKEGKVFLMPECFTSLKTPKGMDIRIPIFSRGVFAGELIKGRFEPSHTLVMALGEKFKNRIFLKQDSKALTSFLHGDVLPCDKNGYTAVCVDSEYDNIFLPIGLGKASGGQLKNKLPKGLRING